MTLPILKGSISFLRQPTETDAASIALYANDEKVSKFLRMPFPYTIDDARDWLARAETSVASGKGAIFSICLNKSNEMIGSIELRNISKIHRNAELGYWLARRH